MSSSIKHCFSKIICLKNTIIESNEGVFPFPSMRNLQKIELNNDKYESIDNCLIEKETKTLVLGCASSKIPEDDKVIAIGDWAFEGCKLLKRISVPNCIKSIGDYAFFECVGLKSIAIPSSVINIGDFAFGNCRKLANIEVNEHNRVYKSIDGNIYTKNGDSLIQYAIGKNNIKFEVPSSVTKICEFSCYGCMGIKNVVIPKSVSIIEEAAFADCIELSAIDVDKNNVAYKSIDGNVYTKNGKIFVQYAIGKRDKDFKIPYSVKHIGNSAFSKSTNLINIEMPDGIEKIGERAFADCIKIENIKLPNSVKIIEDSAFSGCTSLKKIEFSNSLEGMGDFVFADCTSLTSVFLPDSLTTIGLFIFDDCESLKTISIPKHLDGKIEPPNKECKIIVRK